MSALKETCANKTGNTAALDKEKRLNELSQEINGAVAVRDYLTAGKKYEEAIALGLDNDNIRNSTAWYFMQGKELEQAKNHLQAGLALNPNNEYLQGNLALYFLITGDYFNASDIYSRFKKGKAPDGRKWKKVVAEDLDLFERMGMGNENFDKIRDMLKIKRRG